jgi:Ser/Thr protein kinase RdoA (MazF antagonist)
MARMTSTSDDGFAAAAGDVARLFGLGDPTGPLVLAARGEQGVIWRLDTATGSYAVKELVMRRTEEDVAADVAFQECAAAGAASYVVGRTRRTVDGRVLAPFAERQLRVQEWLDMAGLDPSVDPVLVGRMLAELHAVGAARSDPVDPWYTEAVGATRWQEYLSALEGSAYPEVAERLAVGLPDQMSFESLLTEPQDLRTCHRDLWADNVRMTASGRLCVFDWDNCGPASVDHELAMVAWEFGLDDAERIRALLSAYTEAGGPGRVSKPGDFTMLIAQFGHFYELAVAPFLDPTATPADRAHGWARFQEFDSRPLTHAAIAQILDVCTSRPLT